MVIALTVKHSTKDKSMKAHDNGCFFSVTILSSDVEAFKDQWPCSGLPVRAIWAQFDKRNGDLVDIEPSNLEERGADGSALLALIQDGQNYAAKRLKLSDVCFRR